MVLHPAAKNLYNSWRISGMHPTQNLLIRALFHRGKLELNQHRYTRTPHVPFYQFGPADGHC